MPIPAQALKDDVLVRYEHPQLLSKKEVSRPPVFSKNSENTTDATAAGACCFNRSTAVARWAAGRLSPLDRPGALG